MSLDKRALITGATGGIGAAIAKRLAQHFKVILHTHTKLDQAKTLAESIEQSGGLADVVQFNVADAEQTKTAIEKLLEAGPIQCLVNNAGMHSDVPMAGMSLQQWQSVIDVNLHGFFNVTQPLLLPMMSTRWGRIVNISSIAACIGNRGQVNYSAAKSGIHGASKSLALEVASRGISVNVIAPGIIATNMSEQKFTPEHIKKIVPMQRAGQADEVAALAEFLMSEDAGYISGQVISINGAMA